MSGSKKLNNKSNVISENFKRFRQESGYSQSKLCEKLELMGLQLYKADIYSIEHNKRSVRLKREFIYTEQDKYSSLVLLALLYVINTYVKKVVTTNYYLKNSSKIYSLSNTNTY